MKIVYLAKHGNIGSDDTEGHISRSFEKLGHTVIRVQETENETPDGDLLLFHKGGNQNAIMGFTGKRVFWYFDKIDWNDRVPKVRRLIDLADHAFVTDETWALSNPSPKLKILRQGIGDSDTSRGGPREGVWKAQIAFLGGVYGERVKWVELLKNRFGTAFQVYNNVFNRDLYDLCETVPVIVAPPFPSDDYYWSNRIYLTLGSGGFLLHPRLKGLDKEYKHGVHYVGYRSWKELEEKIVYYLNNSLERETIREAGFKKTHEDYSFTKRCQKLLEEIRRS